MSNIIDSIQLSGITYQIEGSGGGKAIEAGRGISITTGETADTVSFNLPISAGTGTNSIIEGDSTTANGFVAHAEGSYTTASGNYSHAEGYGTQANNLASHAEGYQTKASGYTSHAEGWASSATSEASHAEGESTTASGEKSHAEGYYTIASGYYSHAEGYYTIASGDSSHAEGIVTQANGQSSHAEGWSTIANNESEHASGQYNVSSSASTTFGDSGNTLFSVGNGTADNARHNAFEIRQNGDIYISSGNTDIKLQDHLGGGGSVTVDTELDSGSTNPVQNKVIYNKFDEVEEVTAAGLNALNDKITPTVELTQAQYDALATKDPNTYYIITDAQAGDLTNYYTKSETNTLLGGKQATLVSGTNIKTINNESILGSGNIDIQGGGKAVSGGTNISITTGETADTVNCTLPITATSNAFNTISVGAGSGGGSYNTIIGPNARCDNSNGHNVFLVAKNSTSSSSGAYVNGAHNVIIGSIKDGYLNFGIPSFSTSRSVVIGAGGISTDKDYSLAIGYNANVSGTTKTNINNQLTIDTSNQVYIYNKENTEMICLQDQLGGSSITVDTALDSGSTNPVENRVIYNKIDEVEQVTAAGLNALNDNFGGLKLVKLTQAEYNALATKDSSTLYIIVN